MNNHTSLQTHSSGSLLSAKLEGKGQPNFTKAVRQWLSKPQGCEIAARRLRGLQVQ